MKKTLLIILTMLLTVSSWAQQDAMFTHYMYNTMAVNPAYAGSREALTITGIHRSQWVSFDGAPKTQTITMHTPLNRPELGFGLSLLNDKIGPSQSTSIFGDFSYTIKMEKERKLSFGLKAGVNALRIDLNSLSLTQQNDQAFQTNVQSNFLPNFGFGVYYHTPTFYIGASTPKIMQNNFLKNISTVAGDGKEMRHYFLIAGTVFDVSNTVEFKPTTLVKMTVGAPVEADLTGIFIFNQKVLAGGMFRTGDAFGALIGFFIQPNFELGYSYDWSFGLASGRYNGGSHEIAIRYDFIYNNIAKIRSPRYF